MEHQQLKGDLGFVRAAVERGELGRSPASLYFLWAVVCLCGFVLVDVRQTWVNAYWAIAAPAGFLASAVLGYRYARHNGGSSSTIGIRQFFHWAAVLSAVCLARLLPMDGAAILLVLALGYFLAGVHLDRAMLWVGILMGVGYVLVLLTLAYAWTLVGVGLALALALAGFRASRSNDFATA